MPEVNSTEFAELFVEHTVPREPHNGFAERNLHLVEQTRQNLMGSIATMGGLGEEDPTTLRERIEVIFSQHRADLNLFTAVRVLDNYLHNQDWQYHGERREEHQATTILDILSNLADGKKVGHAELATSIGKTYIISKLTEAFHEADLRVLILTPTKTIGNQTIGKDMDKGLTRFAPGILESAIGRQYDGSNATKDHAVVVSTYASLNSIIAKGTIGEFDVILADEAHRALGEVTSQNLLSFSPHAIKLGFTATTEFGVNKSVTQILPDCMHKLGLRESIERNLVAPIQCLTFSTGETIKIVDPNRRDFSDRELSRLISLKSRNEKAIQFAKNFIQEGRQGIISCVPGADLGHAKLLAAQLNELVITDPLTGEERNVIAKAIGSSIKNTEHTLADYAEGKIDVLTFVNALGEGWDSQRASFLINACPTTSIVKITQQIGRVIRKKSDGTTSMLVDFIDEAVGKQQQTALHALSELTVQLSKIYGNSSYVSTGEEASSYLRHILDESLYSQLEAVDGMLVSDLTIPPKAEIDRRRIAFFEKILQREGLFPDTNIMGVPQRLLDAIEGFRDQCLGEQDRLPTNDELYDYLYEYGYLYKKGARQQFERALAAEDVILAGTLENYTVTEETENYRDVQAHLERAELEKRLENIHDGISDRRARHIIKLHYGLGGDSDVLSFREIGEQMGLSSNRISQIEERAMAELRHTYRDNDPLWGWLDGVWSDAQLDLYAHNTINRRKREPSLEFPRQNIQNIKIYREHFQEMFLNGNLLNKSEVAQLSPIVRNVYYDELSIETRKHEIGYYPEASSMYAILANITSHEAAVDENDPLSKSQQHEFWSAHFVSMLPRFFREKGMHDMSSRILYLRKLSRAIQKQEPAMTREMSDILGTGIRNARQRINHILLHWLPKLISEVDQEMSTF